MKVYQWEQLIYKIWVLEDFELLYKRFILCKDFQYITYMLQQTKP